MVLIKKQIKIIGFLKIGNCYNKQFCLLIEDEINFLNFIFITNSWGIDGGMVYINFYYFLFKRFWWNLNKKVGYMKIARGNNQCGIEIASLFPVY